MPAPLAKGLIIATSILIAAGIAFYENEQIREWIQMSRRRIAVALHSLGDEIQPQTAEERERLKAEEERLRREELKRRDRLELLRKARDEGIAVDLDELAAIGKDMEQAADLQGPAAKTNTSGTFDDLVGSDGMLRTRDITSGQTTGLVGNGAEGLRNRGASGFAAGASYANPFEDEAHILHDEDKDLQEAIRQSRETSQTLSPEPQQLIDVSSSTSPQNRFKSDAELDVEIQEAIRRSLEVVPAAAANREIPTLVVDDDANPEMAQTSPLDPPTSVPVQASMPASIYESYYYGPHPSLANDTADSDAGENSAEPQAPPQIFLHDNEYDMPTPVGTMTPTEDGFSTAAASLSSAADDVGVLAELESALSEQGFGNHDDSRSEAADSEAFSVVGVSTPGDWTDVESNPDEDAGGNGGVGAQPHQTQLQL